MLSCIYWCIYQWSLFYLRLGVEIQTLWFDLVNGSWSSSISQEAARVSVWSMVTVSWQVFVHETTTTQEPNRSFVLICSRSGDMENVDVMKNSGKEQARSFRRVRTDSVVVVVCCCWWEWKCSQLCRQIFHRFLVGLIKKETHLQNEWYRQSHVFFVRFWIVVV